MTLERLTAGLPVSALCAVALIHCIGDPFELNTPIVGGGGAAQGGGGQAGAATTSTTASGNQGGGGDGAATAGGTSPGGGGVGGSGVPGPNCAGVPATCGPSGDESCCATQLVPGGQFNRSNEPSYPATISSFVLDRFEVTVGRFRAFVTAGQGTQSTAPAANAGANPNWPTACWETSWGQQLVSSTADLTSALQCSAGVATWTDQAGANENRPINCVNWFEALAFCIWDGGRIPSEAEWNYAAAGGGEQRTYPWSTSPTSPECAQLSYNCAMNDCGDGTSGCAGADIILVGTKPAGDGRWGHADLAGNVFEWAFDWEAEYALPCNDCCNTNVSTFRVLRGGGFRSDSSYVRSSSRDDFRVPTTRRDDIGFRCARDP